MGDRWQNGAVLVFKEGITKKQAEEALDKIKEVLDPEYWRWEMPPVHEFNPDHGGPVWYIP